jgi:hypothetical protein
MYPFTKKALQDSCKAILSKEKRIHSKKGAIFCEQPLFLQKSSGFFGGVFL